MDSENSPARGGTPPKAVAAPEKTPEKKSLLHSIWEFAGFAIIAIIIVIPIRLFVAQPFIVSGSSMVPTFENADYLIVDEISYRLGDPGRYDVVIFKYPKDPNKFFIKRVIGLPNEKVLIKGNTITIVNDENEKGFKLEQPFVQNPGDNTLSFELKAGEYFVMGDNRSASSDSRYWGPVKRDLMVGRAFLRLLPVDEITMFPGNYEPNQ